MAKLIDCSIEGVNDLLRNIDVYMDESITAQAAAIAKVSIDVVNHAKQNHTFQNRTENLENSIQPLPVELQDKEVTGFVQAGMEYAAYVEFGTSRSAPYPYLNPAAEANRQNLIDTMAAAQERAAQVVKIAK